MTTMTSVEVLPGPGMVARFGDVLLWMEEGRTGGADVIASLLDLARAVAEDGADARVGGKVADALNREPSGVPAMVLVAPTSSGLRAIVHGWGRVLAHGVDINGGWSDRELAWTTALAAGRGGDLLRVPTPGTVLDLRRGSTPGGGAAVTLGPRAAAATAPPPEATPAVAGPTPIPARAPSERVHTRPAPAPPEDQPPGEQPPGEQPPGGDDAGGGVTVKGVSCGESPAP